MYINKGGGLYNFCPGKATWDTEAQSLFNVLLVSAETGSMLYHGGISDQPAWWVEMLAWFLPKYDNMKFTSKADMILGGDGKKSTPSMPGPHRKVTPTRQGGSRYRR